MYKTTQAEVSLDQLDPSLRLALTLVQAEEPEVARRILTTYPVLSGRIPVAWVPALVGALAAATGAMVRREGEGPGDFVLVAAR